MPMGNRGVYQPYQPYGSGQSARLAETAPATPRSDKPVPPRLAPWLARSLALVSAILLFLALSLPWVTVHVDFGEAAFDSQVSGMQGLMILTAHVSHSRFVAGMLDLLWFALPLLGLLFGLLLQRRVSRTSISIFGLWLLVATVASLLASAGALTTSGSTPCAESCVGMSRSVEWGAWLTVAALALGWLAFGMLMRQRGTVAYVSPVAAVPFSPLRWAGAGGFSFGFIIWALGLLIVPWATSGCAGLHFSLNHFVRGACSGVDGYDVVIAGLGPNSALIWPFLAITLIVGVFVLVTTWLPRLTRTTWITALGWSLLVTLMLFIGVAGVQVTIAHPPRFSAEAQDVWDPSFGIAICALGIVLGWLGAALLSRVEIVQARQARHVW